MQPQPLPARLTIAPLHARRLERSALIPLWGVMVLCFIRQAASALKITNALVRWGRVRSSV